MPLLNLTTNLKSLTFGSATPYIQKDVNNPGAPSAAPAQARVEDLTRITKYLALDGRNFVAKQALLEASKARTIQSLFSAGTVVNPALRIANILAQIPVNGTGTHFLSIGGGPLSNFYTGNSTAASQALNTGAVTIPRKNSNLVRRVSKSPSFTANPATRASREAAARGVIVTPSRGGTELDNKYGLAPTKTADRVNLFDIGQGQVNDDLMPVMFNIYGDQNTRILFRGFVQNLTDNFNGNWQGANYVGRMEQFFTYTGFTRTLSFQLVVPIFSVEEQPIVYNKLNSLVSYTAPYYQEGSTLPQGNIVSMVIGNYIRTNGILTAVSNTVDTNVPWSYSLPGEYEAAKTRLLPQVLTLNINFTPIHEKAPALYTALHTRGSSNTPYINQSSSPIQVADTPTVPQPQGQAPSSRGRNNNFANGLFGLGQQVREFLNRPNQQQGTSLPNGIVDVGPGFFSDFNDNTNFNGDGGGD